MRCSFGARCLINMELCAQSAHHGSADQQLRPLNFLPCRGVPERLAQPSLPWRSLSSQSRSGRRARPRPATGSATACVPARLSSTASPSGRSALRTSGSATWPSGRWRCCWSRPRATRSPAACSRPKSGGRTRRSMARCQTPLFTLCPYPRTPHPSPHPSPGVARARRPSGARGRSPAHA